MTAATGSAVLWALGPERSFGVPGSSDPSTGLTAYRALLPLAADLEPSETGSRAVNPAGFLEPSLPGPIDGKLSWSLPLTAGHLLPFLEHLFGAVTKTTFEDGVHRYLFEPTRTGADTSFYGLYSRPPVLRTWLYGIKLAKLTFEIGDNEEIPVRLDGAISHGTRLSAAEPHPANAGTYRLGPHLRGPLADPAAGDIYLQVIQLDPLQFKTEQTPGTPTFPGPAVEVALDAANEALWQNLQGATGRDLGYWSENRDPLEVLWPGRPEDHTALAPGDTFRFRAPGTWPDPPLAPLAGHQRFTSAHWLIRARHPGAPAWTEIRARKGTVGIAWPLTAERGNASRYPFALLRDGILQPDLKLERSLLDPTFLDLQEARQPLEIELQFAGRQLGIGANGGSGAHREGLTFRYPHAEIKAATRDPKAARTIAEEITLVGRTNDTGAPPLTVEVTTHRDWTPHV
jgi:hypothetical protein